MDALRRAGWVAMLVTTALWGACGDGGGAPAEGGDEASAGQGAPAAPGGEAPTSVDAAPPGQDATPATRPGPPTGQAGASVSQDTRSALLEGSPVERVEAAFQVADGAGDPAEAGRLLTTAMEAEVAAPAASGAPGTTYLSTTDWVRSGLTRAMGRVAAADPAQAARQQEQAGGEARERWALARGYAGDRGVVDDLRQILVSSASGDVRTDAAYLLGQLGDPSAEPELRQALDDPYEVTWEEDGVPVRFRSVATHAATALARLGLAEAGG